MHFFSTWLDAGIAGAISGFIAYYLAYVGSALFSKQPWIKPVIYILVLLFALLVPHGWQLLQLKVLDNPPIELLMTVKDKDLWQYIEAKFFAFFIGCAIGLITRIKLLGEH